MPADIREMLASNIPQTEIVKAEDADRLWKNRRSLFFKPTAEYDGRATYRGDKVTKRVWQDILAGEYVAQALVVPGQRVTGRRETPASLKFDIRCYTYSGTIQWTGNRFVGGNTSGLNSQQSYKIRLTKLFDEMEALIRSLGSGPRRTVLVLIPEHGSASK